MQAARHRWNPLDLRIQHLDEQSRKDTETSRRSERSAKYTSRTPAKRGPNVKRMYAKRGNRSQRGARCIDANSSLWQQTSRRASHLSGSALSVEVACTARSSKSSSPTKASSSETSPSLHWHELLVAAVRTPMNRLVLAGQATQDDWADSS